MFELRAKSSKETDILLYGTISQWDEVRASEFVKAINAAKDQGYVIINLRINSPGGSIFEGLAIATKIRMLDDLTINAYIDGLAASMASVIACSCDRVFIAKGARMMIHQGKGGVWGSVRQIRDYADLLDSLNKTLADIYNKKTGKEKDWIIKNWMAEGRDTWFTDEEAVTEGLADEVIEGKVKPIKQAATFFEMAAHYEQFFTDTNQNAMDKETKDKLIKKLGLKADATDAEILAAVEQKETSEAPKQEQPKTASQDAIDIVATLAKDRGMTDEQIESVKKLAAVDAKAAMKLIPEAAKTEEPPKAITVNELLAAIKGGESGGAENRSGWTYKDWEKKDPEGLMAMAKTKFKDYAKLFKATYGVEPSETELNKLLAYNGKN